MPTTTLLRIAVRFARASGKPCTGRDAKRIDEALLNGSAELVHGCDYAVNHTTHFEPQALTGEVEVVFEVEVANYPRGRLTTADLLADEVADQVGCFTPEAYEVQSTTTTLA